MFVLNMKHTRKRPIWFHLVVDMAVSDLLGGTPDRYGSEMTIKDNKRGEYCTDSALSVEPDRSRP